ncbi:MAG: hypothetical protein V2A76_16240 [Planctomycetota bacterium]
MRARFALVLLSCLLSAAASGAPAGADRLAAQRAFEEANRQFAQAATADDFLRVAALYQAIMGDGEGSLESGAVLFNLGNCWLFAGETGRAIASYRQAERYRPRDPLLENNLNHALLAAGQAGTQETLLDHVLFWQDWLSFREKAWLVALLGTLVGLSILISLRLGRGWLRAAFLGLLLLVIALISFGLDVRDHELTEHGVTVSKEVVARMGNSESFAPAINEPSSRGPSSWSWNGARDGSASASRTAWTAGCRKRTPSTSEGEGTFVICQHSLLEAGAG